jgi:hypothetical protein
VRDEQVQRYARHILLPDVGGLGQTALMVSAARLELHEAECAAELIAADYLAAGGVGTLAITGAEDSQLAIIATHGPDTKVVTGTAGRPVALAPKPPWWPGAPNDDHALAFWRGSIAAVRWMADVANR